MRLPTSRFLVPVVAAATIVAIVVFAATLQHALFSSSPAEQSLAFPLASPVAGTPAGLAIPKLSIHARVQDVGIAKSGNMAVPTNYTDVGWYRDGPVPGALGSAVMDGHVDNGLALDGVFKHLDTLVPGDDIYITTEAGNRLHFVVSEVADYPYTEVPLERLFARADRARLNLITCTGGWVESGKTYDHRLVVYAELVP